MRVGDIIRPRRGSGRLWRIESGLAGRDRFRLTPLGDDVVAARSNRTGRWQGGPRAITRSAKQLVEGWEKV